MADAPDAPDVTDGFEQLVELRSYTLVPGAAAEFAAHFERHFVVSQEELGMDIVGRFTVPGDDARFVWIRRYLRPATRGEALRSFYTGPVWTQFGPRANELLLDCADVHLLAPDRSAPTFPAAGRPRPRPGGSTVVAALYDLDVDVDPGPGAGAGPGPALGADTTAAMTAAAAADADVAELGRLVTAPVANDFPALPFHEDRTVALWLLADHTTADASAGIDAANGDAAVAVARAVARQQDLTLRTILLTPTPGSPLR